MLHVSEVRLHKDFNFEGQVNDIALLKTSKSFVAPGDVNPLKYQLLKKTSNVC